MQTNKFIEAESELHKKGQALLAAAYEYWKQYKKDVGRSAVVWIEGADGHFVLFTRSEYKQSILANASRDCHDQEMLFEPFKP